MEAESVLSRGEGVKIGQNLVPVVVECPLNLKIANSLAIFDLKITLVQVSASVSTTYKILFLVTFVVTFCPVMQGALFKINLLHICKKYKIKSKKLIKNSS